MRKRENGEVILSRRSKGKGTRGVGLKLEDKTGPREGFVRR